MPSPMRAEIVAHAREARPSECCGLIAGRGGVPTRLIPCANAHLTPVIRYAIDPREQLAAFRSMDGAGEELLAVYHSHPASQPYPSPTDRAEWHYPESFAVLVSLRAAEPELHAYRIAAGGAVTEVRLEAG